MSNAAGFPLSHPATSTLIQSARGAVDRSEPTTHHIPDWQSINTFLSWLWQVTASSPHLQVLQARWPRQSSVISGQSEQREPPEGCPY